MSCHFNFFSAKPFSSSSLTVVPYLLFAQAAVIFYPLSLVWQLAFWNLNYIYNILMIKKYIIKINDLKLYTWASSFDLINCKNLYEKFSVLSVTSFKGDHAFWMCHHDLIMDLMFFKSFILEFKDLIVLKANEFYLVEQAGFKDSEALLLDYLDRLCRFWIGLVPILAEAKKEYPDCNSIFGDLEYSFLDILFGSIFAMNEILIILHKKDSKFLFKKITDFEYDIGVFTLRYVKPMLPTNAGFKDIKLLTISDKKTLIKHGILTLSFFAKQEIKDLLYSWLKMKIEFKFRIKDLTEEEVIALFVMEVFMDLEIETLRFLAVNHFIDMDDLRQVAKEHAKKQIGKPDPLMDLFKGLAEQIKKSEK